MKPSDMVVVPDRFIRDHLGQDWALIKPDRIDCVLFSADQHSMKIYLKPQGCLNFKINKGGGNPLEKYFLIDPEIKP